VKGPMATEPRLTKAVPQGGGPRSIRLPMITGRAGPRLRRSLLVFPLSLLALAACVDTLSAQVPARVATPYSDRRRWVEFMMTFELGLGKPDPARALGVDSPQLDRRIRAAGNES
jgi:hypothetical protein